MWVVKGETVAGKTVEYRVPTGKDTEKAFVMALAFQEHGKAAPDDALTANVEVSWVSDNVLHLPEDGIALSMRQNFAVDKRVAKGVWERHSQRAFRTLESATDALESAASEYPNDKFRIVVTTQTTNVIAISKNAMPGEVNEEPDKPKAEPEGVKAEGDVETGTDKVETAAKPSRTPKPKAAA